MLQWPRNKPPLYEPIGSRIIPTKSKSCVFAAALGCSASMKHGRDSPPLCCAAQMHWDYQRSSMLPQVIFHTALLFCMDRIYLVWQAPVGHSVQMSSPLDASQSHDGAKSFHQIISVQIGVEDCLIGATTVSTHSLTDSDVY